VNTYQLYLRSPWWTARKAAVIRARGYRCQRCGSRYELELHHRTYVRLGHELPDDVELLCAPCHGRQHGHQRGQDPDEQFERLDYHSYLEQLETHR
jgi:5-methylcytosine-specific restriction endonuclease McrA